jgi:hypothetical protein
VHPPRVTDHTLRGGKDRAKNAAPGTGNRIVDMGSTCR